MSNTHGTSHICMGREGGRKGGVYKGEGEGVREGRMEGERGMEGGGKTGCVLCTSTNTFQL